jgi:Putative Ig domain
MSLLSRAACIFAITLGAILAQTQQTAPATGLRVAVGTEGLPKASLWTSYFFRLPASGGVGLYHWRLNGGTLPAGLKLAEDGELKGVPQETGQFDFNLLLTDSDNPAKQLRKKFKLSLDTPLAIEWVRKAKVNGQRIEGSIKVSNHTGRDFDLTMVVLAVNETGRATAIGYQHFPLKKNTRDMEIPFGDTPSWGVYQVNVDVVAEEPVSNRIFRARLVVPKLAVTQGP